MGKTTMSKMLKVPCLLHLGAVQIEGQLLTLQQSSLEKRQYPWRKSSLEWVRGQTRSCCMRLMVLYKQLITDWRILC